MDVIWLKTIAFFSFILVGGLFAMLPYFAFKRFGGGSQHRTVLQMAECFAGGVFLGTGWVHLLPEAASSLQSVESGVPLANMLSVCGFLIVFLIEKVFFLQDPEEYVFEDLSSKHSKKDKKRKNIKKSNSKSKGQNDVIPLDDMPLKSESSTVMLITKDHEEQDIKMDTIKISISHEKSDSPIDISPSSSSIQDGITTELEMEEPSLSNQFIKKRRNHDNHEHDPSKLLTSVSNTKNPFARLLPYMLMIILSIHSVIAGVTLGVADSTTSLAPLFIAIISHKWTESIALGVSLLKLPEFKTIVKCVILYTAMVPLGILIGSILSIVLSEEVSELTGAILNGLASGTFIYVAIVDILLEQFSEASNKFWKYITTVIGFITITVLLLLFDED